MATTHASKKAKRVMLRLNAEQAGHLEEMRKLARIGKAPEVIRKALRVYDWYLKATKDGGTICIRESDGTFRDVEFL